MQNASSAPRQPRSILHVIASCDPGGGGPIEGVRLLGQAFAERGVRQELLTLDTPDMPWVADFPAPVHAMGEGAVGAGVIGRARAYINGAPRAVRWLRDHAADYDGVIVDGLWNYSTRVARLGLPDSGVPYIAFTHGMLDPWFARTYPAKHMAKRALWRINEGVLLRGASAVAFTCEQERLLARRSFAPWGMREAVVGFGTSAPPAEHPGMVAAFRARVPALADRPYLLFMSRIHEKKGCDVLIAAFARIAGAFPETDLVIAGPGEPDLVAALQRQAEAAGVAGRIHWPGMLAGDAKWGALYGCEAMTLSSHQENFGVIVVEALACGRRVVISDQVNIHDEVTAADAGFVGSDTVDGTEPQLVAALRQSPADRSAMESRARALFAERFDMGRTAERLLAIIADAAAGQPLPRAKM